MSAHEVWFARRFPVEHGGARMVPVHWKGFAMFGVFAAAMLLGGGVFALCAMSGNFVLGVTLYVLIAAAGVAALFWAVVARSDNTRTYKEFRKTTNA